MADQSGQSGSAPFEKGKGKAPNSNDDIEMGENSEEEEDEDEENDEDYEHAEAEPEEEDEDNMEDIDLDNIIETGRRTRGKKIDFAKAHAETPVEPGVEDAEDDEDYEAPGDDMEH